MNKNQLKIVSVILKMQQLEQIDFNISIKYIETTKSLFVYIETLKRTVLIVVLENSNIEILSNLSKVYYKLQNNKLDSTLCLNCCILNIILV